MIVYTNEIVRERRRYLTVCIREVRKLFGKELDREEIERGWKSGLK